MDEKRKINHFSYGAAILLGIMIAVFLEACIAGYWVSRGYGKDSEVFPLIPVSANGYVVGGEEGKLWVKTEDNCWVIFCPEKEVGHIRIHFQEPLLEEMDIRCFYGINGEFNPYQRKQRYLLEGTKEAVITVPYGHWNTLRLDISGDFLLDGFEGGQAVPLRQITANQIAGQINPGRILFFLCLFPLSGILFMQKMEKKRQIGDKGKPTKERIVFFDAVRVLASLMVIFTHVLEPMGRLYDLTAKPGTYAIFLALQFISISCNQLFFMMSGALLLPWRDEKPSVFFRKRVLKVVLPLLVYGWIYLFFLCSSKAPAGDMAIAYLLCMLRGSMRTGPHLWMVFELIGMYILVIPFRGLLHHASERTEKLLAGFILVLMGVENVGKYLRIELGISTFLSGWTGVFLMGYLFRKEWMRKYDRLWMGGGAAALVLGIILSIHRGSYAEFIYGTSLFMQLISTGIFAGIFHLENYLKKAGRILAFFSKYSYSVLLIHWFTLYGVVFVRGISAAWPLPRLVLTVFICCTVLSFIFSVFIDNTLMAVLEWGLGKIKRK